MIKRILMSDTLDNPMSLRDKLKRAQALFFIFGSGGRTDYYLVRWHSARL